MERRAHAKRENKKSWYIGKAASYVRIANLTLYICALRTYYVSEPIPFTDRFQSSIMAIQVFQ